MKVEKINENKIRITLTFEELRRRQISVHDLEKDSEIAKDLFIDLIEESNLEDDFPIDDSQLFIEASSDNNNLFVVTITKIDNIPELKKYSLLESKKNTKRSKKLSKNDEFMYRVDSNIYAFDSLDTILNMCESAKGEKLFFGKNSLYQYKDEYFLIFSKSSVKNTKFLKTYVFLSEYCKEYYSYSMYETSIKEKAKLIIANTALQKLNKI